MLFASGFECHWNFSPSELGSVMYLRVNLILAKIPVTFDSLFFVSKSRKATSHLWKIWLKIAHFLFARKYLSVYVLMSWKQNRILTKFAWSYLVVIKEHKFTLILTGHWGTVTVNGKQNSLFRIRPLIKGFVIPPNSKREAKTAKTLLACYWPTNKFSTVSRCTDLITCKSKLQAVIFPGEVASFVWPQENRFELEGMTTAIRLVHVCFYCPRMAEICVSNAFSSH